MVLPVYIQVLALSPVQRTSYRNVLGHPEDGDIALQAILQCQVPTPVSCIFTLQTGCISSTGSRAR